MPLGECVGFGHLETKWQLVNVLKLAYLLRLN